MRFSRSEHCLNDLGTGMKTYKPCIDQGIRHLVRCSVDVALGKNILAIGFNRVVHHAQNLNNAGRLG
jgi:hypothetical protein